MDIAERIGDYKQAHNVAIYQPSAGESIMRRQLRKLRGTGTERSLL
jgi:hypothetical protein